MQIILEEYRNVFRFLRSIRFFLIITLAAIISISALTWVIAAQSESLREAATLAISDMFESKEIYEPVEEDGTISLSPVHLIFNNIRAVGLGYILGLIPFIFLPILSLALNFVIIGFLGATMTGSGISISLFLFFLLPHGIFEVPAMILSYAMGLFLCSIFTRQLLHKPRHFSLQQALRETLRVMVLLVFPLLIAAGLMESYVTPIIMSYFV